MRWRGRVPGRLGQLGRRVGEPAAEATCRRGRTDCGRPVISPQGARTRARPGTRTAPSERSKRRRVPEPGRRRHAPSRPCFSPPPLRTPDGPALALRPGRRGACSLEGAPRRTLQHERTESLSYPSIPSRNTRACLLSRTARCRYRARGRSRPVARSGTEGSPLQRREQTTRDRWAWRRC